jgi:hypothetical protein
MNMYAYYRLLLGFYPRDFRREFSEEMLHVFERRVLDLACTGKKAYLVFVVYEFCSLLKGAQAMWIEKIIPRRNPPVRKENVPETALDTVELQERREEAARRMVQAIATHDFPGARRYSEEEIRLSHLLTSPRQ